MDQNRFEMHAGDAVWGPWTALGLTLLLLCLTLALGAGIATGASLISSGAWSPLSAVQIQIGILVSSAIVAVLAVRILRARAGQARGLSAPRGALVTLVAVPAAFSCAVLAYPLLRAALAVTAGVAEGRSVTDSELLVLASSDRWLVIANSVVAAPVLEELLFRGLLLPSLARSRIGFAGATVVTTLLFVAMHPGGLAKLSHVVSIIDWHVIMSVGLCLVWRLTRSLWPCVLGHAASNLTLIVQILSRA